MKQALGKLKKIDLRKAWEHEALDFTKWLAKEENLALLSEEIGVDLNLVETEASVGSFNVDILAEDSNGRKVVIENQLEITDHDHLGKVLTYTSGYNAEIIIWIAKDIRDEHKQAIDWLNEHTDENINFFAIKMELWQIEDSLYAPKFQIICKPNAWAKIMRASTSSACLTERKLKLLEFWTALNNYLNNKNSSIKPQKPSSDHWNNVSIGTAKAHISLTALAKDNKIGCDIYIPNNKEFYYELETHKNDIEKMINEPLLWQELKNKKASRIIVNKENFDLYDDSKWNNYFAWFEEKAIKFKETFRKCI